MEQQRIKVMVIDNHQFSIDAITYLFNNKATDVDVVCKLTDGNRVISLINDTKPDVIVMDPYLSNISGVELVGEIIATYGDLIKLVMFASFACEELIRILYKIGINAFVLKEEPFKVLVNAVKQSYLGNILVTNREILKKSNCQLTMTEIEILQLISQEKKNHEIAKILNMSKRTVEYHITSMFQKLDVDSRVGAIMKGAQKGLIYS